MKIRKHRNVSPKRLAASPCATPVEKAYLEAFTTRLSQSGHWVTVREIDIVSSLTSIPVEDLLYHSIARNPEEDLAPTAGAADAQAAMAKELAYLKKFFRQFVESPGGVMVGDIDITSKLLRTSPEDLLYSALHWSKVDLEIALKELGFSSNG